jgi:acyl carrier protein phosphodiesterase
LKRLLAIAGLLACGLPLPGHAQPQEPDEDRNRWYQVDLILFDQGDPSALLAEQWPEQPVLAYPESLAALQDGPLTEAVAGLPRLVTVEDSAPATLDLFWERTVTDLWREWRAIEAERAEAQRTALETPMEPGPAPPRLEVPRERVRLPEAARGLQDARRRLRGSRDKRVLWHESWLQVLRNGDEPPALLVQTGEARGRYPLLQGSIRLYAGRYLHLETRLWLNTDGSYLDGDWPMSPPPPPPEVTDKAAQPSEFRVQLGPDWASPRPIDTAAPLVDMPAGLEGWLADAGVDYPWRHAIPIEQRRRMRSGELHYVDHPLVGILVMVTPWEFPAAAKAEPGLNPAAREIR